MCSNFFEKYIFGHFKVIENGNNNYDYCTTYSYIILRSYFIVRNRFPGNNKFILYARPASFLTLYD